MQEASVDEIRRHAARYVKDKKKWHFHILTPECQLNDQKSYALIIENGTDNEVFICYSEKPYMDIGRELVQLLHGNDVIKKEGEEHKNPPSQDVKKLLKRAGELINKGKFWHHHMLFPYCRYNKYKNKWTIIFEDKENNEIIESVTDSEPKNDLQYIEALFYSQKK